MTHFDLEPGGAGSGAGPVRQVHSRDPAAPTPTVVTPSVFVAVREEQGSLLLVRRRDSGAWELPGGCVEIGESAVGAAVRETAEKSGLRVQITGLVGLFTDPAQVVRSAADGEIRQQFVVVLHGWAVKDRPRADGDETVDAAWFPPAAVEALTLEPGALRWINHALAGASDPHLE